MNKIAGLTCAAGFLLASSTQASLIFEGHYIPGSPFNASHEEALVESELGLGDLIYLGKYDGPSTLVQGSAGTLIGTKIVVSNYASSGDKVVTVDWDLTGVTSGGLQLVLEAVFLKDGTPHGHSIYTTTGTALDFQKVTDGTGSETATWNPNNPSSGGSISHVSFYGRYVDPTTFPPTGLPDGGATAVLLGLGLLGLAGLRRKA